MTNNSADMEFPHGGRSFLLRISRKGAPDRVSIQDEKGTELGYITGHISSTVPPQFGIDDAVNRGWPGFANPKSPEYVPGIVEAALRHLRREGWQLSSRTPLLRGGRSVAERLRRS